MAQCTKETEQWDQTFKIILSYIELSQSGQCLKNKNKDQVSVHPKAHSALDSSEI